MRALVFVLTSCLSKLSKLGLAVAAVGKILLFRRIGEVGFALQGLLCSPACSCHVCNRNSQGLDLVRAEFLGRLKEKGLSLVFTCSQILVGLEVEKEQSDTADGFFQALFSYGLSHRWTSVSCRQLCSVSHLCGSLAV